MMEGHHSRDVCLLTANRCSHGTVENGATSFVVDMRGRGSLGRLNDHEVATLLIRRLGNVEALGARRSHAEIGDNRVTNNATIHEQVTGLNDGITDIFTVSHLIEERHQVKELAIVLFLEPCGDRHGMVRLEHVGHRRVINDHTILRVTTESGQVLHVVAEMRHTAFTEKARIDNTINIELVKEGICVFRERCGEDDNLPLFTDSSEEFIDIRTLANIHAVNHILQIDIDFEIRIVNFLKRKR